MKMRQTRQNSEIMERKDGKIHLDLVKAKQDQLLIDQEREFILTSKVNSNLRETQGYIIDTMRDKRI